MTTQLLSHLPTRNRRVQLPPACRHWPADRQKYIHLLVNIITRTIFLQREVKAALIFVVVFLFFYKRNHTVPLVLRINCSLSQVTRWKVNICATALNNQTRSRFRRVSLLKLAAFVTLTRSRIKSKNKNHTTTPLEVRSNNTQNHENGSHVERGGAPPVAHLARSMQGSFRVADELKYSLAAASTRSTLLS